MFTYFLNSIKSPRLDNFIRVCVIPKKGIFSGHILDLCIQQASENLDQYRQKLRSLAKNCNFKSATVEKNQEDVIRIAFILEIQSHMIHQGLLEIVFSWPANGP